MARVNSVAQMNQTLLAADFGDIEELWAFQITCIREMDLISGGHVALSRSIKLRSHRTQYFAVCTFERVRITY